MNVELLPTRPTSGRTSVASRRPRWQRSTVRFQRPSHSSGSMAASVGKHRFATRRACKPQTLAEALSGGPGRNVAGMPGRSMRHNRRLKQPTNPGVVGNRRPHSAPVTGRQRPVAHGFLLPCDGDFEMSSASPPSQDCYEDTRECGIASGTPQSSSQCSESSMRFFPPSVDASSMIHRSVASLISSGDIQCIQGESRPRPRSADVRLSRPSSSISGNGCVQDAGVLQPRPRSASSASSSRPPSSGVLQPRPRSASSASSSRPPSSGAVWSRPQSANASSLQSYGGNKLASSCRPRSPSPGLSDNIRSRAPSVLREESCEDDRLPSSCGPDLASRAYDHPCLSSTQAGSEDSRDIDSVLDSNCPSSQRAGIGLPRPQSSDSGSLIGGDESSLASECTSQSRPKPVGTGMVRTSRARPRSAQSLSGRTNAGSEESGLVAIPEIMRLLLPDDGTPSESSMGEGSDSCRGISSEFPRPGTASSGLQSQSTSSTISKTDMPFRKQRDSPLPMDRVDDALEDDIGEPLQTVDPMRQYSGFHLRPPVRKKLTRYSRHRPYGDRLWPCAPWGVMNERMWLEEPPPAALKCKDTCKRYPKGGQLGWLGQHRSCRRIAPKITGGHIDSGRGTRKHATAVVTGACGARHLPETMMYLEQPSLLRNLVTVQEGYDERIPVGVVDSRNV